MTAEKWAEKIGKLLAMAEGGATAEERQAFSEQAERLMIKWGVEEAVARAAAGSEVKPEEIVTRRISFVHIGSTFDRAYILSMFSVVHGLGLRAWRNGWRYLTVVGFESDVDRAEMLINSLVLQQTAAHDQWWSVEKRSSYYASATYHEKWQARMDFHVSFGEAVGARLWRMNNEEVESVPGAALAIVDRKKAVDDAFEACGVKRGRSHSFGGSAAGYRAGQEASLGEKGLSGRRSLEG